MNTTHDELLYLQRCIVTLVADAQTLTAIEAALANVTDERHASKALWWLAHIRKLNQRGHHMAFPFHSFASLCACIMASESGQPCAEWLAVQLEHLAVTLAAGAPIASQTLDELAHDCRRWAADS